MTIDSTRPTTIETALSYDIPLVFVDFDDQLSEVLTFEHANQCFGCAVEAFDYVLPKANAAFGNPCAHLIQNRRPLIPELANDEAAQGQAADQDLSHGRRESIGAVRVPGAVVLRDQTANRHPCVLVQERQHRLPDSTADQFEIDIDTVRTGGGQLVGKLG